MTLPLSVIICTYNSRRDHLLRTLQGLSRQTLAANFWELLIVDNGTEKLILSDWDLSWHSQARFIKMDEVGLTLARLRGIHESRGEVLVFVDDDNVLDPRYLEEVLVIDAKWKMLGVWGGQIRPEFETAPAEWTKTYLCYLAVRDFSSDRWSNVCALSQIPLCGAGMCVRRSVAIAYSQNVCSSPKRLNLDRKGDSLVSSGDIDIALTAIDLGFGMGQFVALKLIHLIPEARMSERYLLRLVEAIAYSNTILHSIRGRAPNLSVTRQPTMLRRLYWIWKYSSRRRRFLLAELAGKQRAAKEILLPYC